MMTSAIIPILNEKEDDLRKIISNLTYGYTPEEIQLVIVNDGSIKDSGGIDYCRWLYKGVWDNLSVVQNIHRYGVGYSFDRGVNAVSGDIIVLMGADTYPAKGKWLQSLKNIIKDDELGCACSVGLSPGSYDIEEEGLYHRYGAKILYTMTKDDLPKNSKLRQNEHYRDILEAKWEPKKSNQPYIVDCVLGAFYWIKREQYLRMGGFDTEIRNRFKGHSYWGALEPYLSLKARVYGLKPTVYPDFKVGHCFGRIEEYRRANRLDLKYWNKFFIANTLLAEPLRSEVVNYLGRSLNLNLARDYIKKNWDTVQASRQRNIENGKLISR